MSEAGRPEVTLHTLHQDLREVKALVTAGLRAFPPDWPGEMLRTLRENTQLSRENTQLLRENNRLSEERFTRLDVTLREQAIETQTHGFWNIAKSRQGAKPRAETSPTCRMPRLMKASPAALQRQANSITKNVLLMGAL
jgi:hypothetical protein